MGFNQFSRCAHQVLDPFGCARQRKLCPAALCSAHVHLGSDVTRRVCDECRGIQAIMRRRGWRVGLLTELPPNEETVETPPLLAVPPLGRFLPGSYVSNGPASSCASGAAPTLPFLFLQPPQFCLTCHSSIFFLHHFLCKQMDGKTLFPGTLC